MLRDLSETWLVVPCFNEEMRLPQDEIASFLSARPGIGVCLVDDGSSDGTAAKAEQMRVSSGGAVEVVRLPANQGKGHAVRCGVLSVLDRHTPLFVGYWDADLATPLEEVDRFLDILKRDPHCQMVAGCRVSRLGAHIERKHSRHYLGRVFATLASLVLAEPIYDTQCGAKVLRAGLARQVFSTPFVSAWCFDIELFARIRRLSPHEDLRDIVVEAPLSRWQDRPGSKLRLSHVFRMLLDLARIAMRYRARR